MNLERLPALPLPSVSGISTARGDVAERLKAAVC
jgi:hypothetical protein